VLARCESLEATAARLIGTGTAPRDVITATQDPDQLVRVVALEALRDIGDPRTFAAARACLRDGSPLVRSYAAVALAVLDGARARAILDRAAPLERSSTARVGFAEARLALGDRAALRDLLRLLRSRQYRVRCAAANILSDADLMAVERVEVRRAIDAALAVEPTVAARSTLEAARRRLGRPYKARKRH